MFTKSIVLSGLVAIASSHIIITNPVPYGKSSLTNFPLKEDGGDFPCKMRDGVYDAQGASNVYAQGSKQQLEFQGTAVHGGGSCQVSITTDLKPTKDSVWRVIKSIEGGCPAKDQTGNIGNSAEAKVPYTYDYTIPKELAAGNYTLAWTWFNKVGNREMYMNCAPLSVTGNGGSQSFMNGLPEMFTANIFGPAGCKIAADTDVKFPFPGTDVDRFGEKTSSALQAPTAGCVKSGTGAAPSTSAAGGESAPAPTASAAPSPSMPTNDAGAPSASVPGGVFITSQNPQPDPTQVPSTGNSSVPAMSSMPPAMSSMPVPTSAPANPSPGGGHAAGSACSTEGQWNCIGGKSFQRCASGMWSAVQGMAAGVSCEAGESSDLKMAASPGKRAMRRALRA
ncbi:hypothetical protein LMH87_002414 [Akanthomyces muscarius]|uniref:Uncharacterized protein n=2 Tax=Akanthomyces muscarius TaxID=2231603 RepID=A0A9W8Q8G3_AKAMU|nr:hypothetical protein LMH87_002414 [Akanthomyces muscarius]KAJ4147918.1 hypothetical protein LMH87_002414 [Akanthomyces muscarius]